MCCLAILALILLPTLSEITDSPQRWVVYYNDEAPLQAFEPYELVVLDSDHHPILEGFIQQGKTILGYISLGEVEEGRSYFSEVEKDGILLEENKNWPGSYFVDLRDPRWGKRVIEELIPDILMKRFHGLFFDTLDNAAYLEEKDPEKYQGMVNAAIDLVRAIRMHYPKIKIMMNRAYTLQPYVADSIEMILGESVFADYDFEKKTYQRVPDKLYREQVKLLKETKKRNPGIRVYTLDYWDPDDAAGIEKIYQEQRKNGFIPYVSTIDLHKIIPEPNK